MVIRIYTRHCSFQRINNGVMFIQKYPETWNITYELLAENCLCYAFNGSSRDLMTHWWVRELSQHGFRIVAYCSRNQYAIGIWRRDFLPQFRYSFKVLIAFSYVWFSGRTVKTSQIAAVLKLFNTYSLNFIWMSFFCTKSFNGGDI